MTPERWVQIRQIFERALESETRDAFVSEACLGDEELLREVESLLAQHSDSGDPILDRPVWAVVGNPVSAASEKGDERPFAKEAKCLDKSPSAGSSSRAPDAAWPSTYSGCWLPGFVGKYRILRVLGEGGMGIVYKALDSKLERIVALKFLPQGVAVSDEDKRNLLREARAASALDHPNIGVIHGLEESEDRQLFIVMQYYDGETLAQKISRGVIPARESLDLAIQIAGGLTAAHAHNIVHRDIKPSNIIITSTNVAKIVDFGLARVVVSISATQSISATGTLPYMAPEQILGETIDQRSDIWALGVIIVQMITGSHPCAGCFDRQGW